MEDIQIIKNLIFKIPDDSEFIDTAKFYLKAYGITDLSKVEELVKFWKLFIDSKICYFTVAKYNEKIIGSGAVITYHSIAWIAWMAVDPIFQRKGVGNEIMKNLLCYTEKMGIKTLKLDASKIGKKLYLNYEFKEEYRVIWYEIKPRSSLNDFKGLNITVTNKIPNWCLTMDREAFGDDRSQLLKLLLNNGGKIIMLDDEGYGILWKNRIGPIIAENVAIAKNIVKYASKMGAEKIYIPLHQQLSKHFLLDLQEKKSNASISCCTRMINGEHLKENIKNVYASFAAATG